MKRILVFGVRAETTRQCCLIGPKLGMHTLGMLFLLLCVCI